MKGKDYAICILLSAGVALGVVTAVNKVPFLKVFR